MEQTGETKIVRVDKDIIFSKAVKAGKRLYYIDVKRDCRDSLYLAITESKRIKDAVDGERPVFEKHKIFLYREDLDKFMEGITSCIDYIVKNSSAPKYPNKNKVKSPWFRPEELVVSSECVTEPDLESKAEEKTEEESPLKDTAELSGEKIKIDLDF